MKALASASNPDVTTDAKEKPRPKRRRSKEERLAAALAKQQALQAKIQGLQRELSEKSRKNRSRGLLLTGLVVEMCLKKGVFEQPGVYNRDWWQQQADLLQEKDKVVYTNFIMSITTGTESGS